MGCDFPLKAYRTEELSPSGKRLLTFNPLKAVNSTLAIDLPCGQCMGCRLDRAQQWAQRIVHESKMHDDNSFITLTYDDENVPQDYSLSLRHWQLFMKRLRKSQPQKLRFFACGEYGDQLGRPHYHAIVFNLTFPNKTLYSKKNNNPLYTSPQLTDLWPYGFSTFGSVTPDSAGYVARYSLKKINGDRAVDHYYRLSPIDGQMHHVRPEFAVMSRRPGLGFTWFEKFKSDIFPSGYLIKDGHRIGVPAYYKRKLEEDQQTQLKRQNKRRALAHKGEITNRHRHAKVVIRAERLKQLKREL